jgi:hypothetical protein
MIQDREPLKLDAPRSARTPGADPVGWRSMSMVMCRSSLAAPLLVQPVHAEIGNAAFYGAVTPGRSSM